MRARKHRSTPSLARLRPARGAFQQKLLLLGTLLTFVLQSYVVQTHIHFAPGDIAGAIASEVAGTKANTSSSVAGQHDSKLPIDDPARCPICQEFLHAGQYVTPAPVLALLITFVVVPITIERIIAVAISPVSHAWRGRAPPSA